MSDNPAPLIVMPPVCPKRLGVAERAVALFTGAGLLLVLLLALAVKPDPSGVGTHEQLGLRRCDFLHRTGYPCPSCGMTTAAALFVRGRVFGAFVTQPLGALLTAATGAAFWVCLYIGITGRPVHRLARVGFGTLTVVIVALAAGAWAWKILIHRGILRV